VLYCAAGCDPFELLDRGVAAAARLSGGCLPSSQLCARGAACTGRLPLLLWQPPGTHMARAVGALPAGSSLPRWEKEVPASLDVFGWCSWDAFYTGVNPRGLQEGLHRLARGGTPARLLIIDDGWQSMGGWVGWVAWWVSGWLGGWGGAQGKGQQPCLAYKRAAYKRLGLRLWCVLTVAPLTMPDVDAQYKTDAEGGVLRGWATRAVGELEDKLAVGRLLAGQRTDTVPWPDHGLPFCFGSVLVHAGSFSSLRPPAHAPAPPPYPLPLQAQTSRRWSRCT
jgi:hypothetical protein